MRCCRNLAAHSSSKPVTATEEGAALVSGYSQGMLKVFPDDGEISEGDMEDESTVLQKEGEGEDKTTVIVDQKKKEQINLLKMLQKAISNGSYQMLKVVD